MGKQYEIDQFVMCRINKKLKLQNRTKSPPSEPICKHAHNAIVELWSSNGWEADQMNGRGWMAEWLMVE